MDNKFSVRKLLKASFGAAILAVIAFAAMSSLTGVGPLEAATGQVVLSAQCTAQVTCPNGITLFCLNGFGGNCRTGETTCTYPITDVITSEVTQGIGRTAFVNCFGGRRECPCRPPASEGEIVNEIP